MSSLFFYSVENSKNKDKPLNGHVQTFDWYSVISRQLKNI
jgi:hypothetical protein